VTVSNGLGWSPDGHSMYYVDSPTCRVDVFDYDLATGIPSGRRCLVETRDLAGFPDGLAVDAEGCLWIAFWDGGSIHRFSPDGELVGTVTVPVPRPTSCAFVGADLESLVITTAAALDGTGGDVFACEPDVSGMAVEAFDG
jgi:sugar lactone lactonase YvrE